MSREHSAVLPAHVIIKAINEGLQEGDDNMTDSCMKHNPFANGMPKIDSFEEVEDCYGICMCTDCEGTWI